MNKVKEHRLTFRFADKRQKNAIKRVAKKRKNSLNSEIQIAIDKHISIHEPKTATA